MKLKKSAENGTELVEFTGQSIANQSKIWIRICLFFFYFPNNFRQNVAFIIPFRDREQHLRSLMLHLHPILRRQQLSYQIFVVEQVNPDLGMLDF